MGKRARIWVLAGALVLAYLIIFALQDLVQAGTLLTMSVGVGAGATAAFLPGSKMIARSIYLFVGVLIGAIGFVLGAAAFTDNNFGLMLGAVVPTILIALAATVTGRISDFLACVLGAGVMGGVYANVFDADPQSLNVSLPIAIGQSILPLGFGFLVGVVILMLLPSDEEAEAARADDDGPPGDEPEEAGEEPVYESEDTAEVGSAQADQPTQQVEVNR
jgi:hypothetical protein